MARSVTLSVSSTSHISTQSDRIVARPSGAEVLLAGRQLSAVGRMERFRKALKGEGVLKLTATLIANSRRLGSISNYQLACQKWATWFYK